MIGDPPIIVWNDLPRRGRPMTRTKYAELVGKPWRGIEGIIPHHFAVDIADNRAVRATARYHVEDRGWSIMGYSSIITMDGTINLCAETDIATPHIWGRNHEFYGVAFNINGNKREPTDKQIHSFNWLRKWLFPGMPTWTHREKALAGHGTSCPGTLWENWIHKLEGRI